MSNDIIEAPIQDVETIPATETVVELPPTPPIELRYEYQPTDEQNRPLGGKQVILYTDPQQLASKLAEQNTLLLRKLRAETRKNRLGIVENDTVSEDAPRFAQPLSFKPKELSAEDRLRISRDLADPERFDQASDELFTAKIGVAPSKLAETLSELQQDRINQQAQVEVEAFKRANPDFVMCQENSDAITNWLLRYELAPVRANFQRAYNTLKSAGIIIENVYDTAPVVEPVVAPVAQVVPEPVVEQVVEQVIEEITSAVEPEPAPRTTSRVPVSLNRNNAEDTGGAPPPVGSDIVYEIVQNGQKRRFTGLAAINAMPANEYRKRVLSDPTFAKKEAALEKEAADRRKRRG